MAKWNSYTPISGGLVADADLVPYSDEGEAVGSKSKVASIATLRTVLAGTSIATTTDPGVGDDTADGYRAGSLWLNTTDGGLFVCEDASAGAAVWTERALASGTGDVVGPAGATSGNIATFNGTTGKLIQDGGISSATFATAAQGALADTAVQPADPVSINAQTGTTYTFALGDEEDFNTFANASPVDVTIPTNAAVAFAVGTVLVCGQKGAGLVTCTGDTGVTVNGVSAGSVDSAGQWSTWTLTKVATDEWWASGGLA